MGAPRRSRTHRRPGGRRRGAALLLSALVATVAPWVWRPPLPALAEPEGAPEETWVTNGRVRAIVRSADRIYIGGHFTQVGPNTGHGTAVADSDGARNPAFPRINGVVHTAVPDGSGGWFLAGDFTYVGGVYRHNAAQITASGQVTAWNPRVEGAVYALAYSPAWQRVFLITSVGSTARTRLAAVQTGKGSLDPGWRPTANGTVRALVPDGDRILAGGSFTSVSGTSRARLAALDATTGSVGAWNPGANGDVHALALSPDRTTVYAGGDFTTAGGTGRARLAAIDAVSGSATGWNPGADGGVLALAVSPDGATVYAGGRFASVGGAARATLASLASSTGEARAWNPGTSGCSRATPESPPCAAAVHALGLSPDGATLFAGGQFQQAGGGARNNAAAFDTSPGALTGWDPSPNATVGALAPSGSQVFVGGDLTSINAPTRNRVAALDIVNGALDPAFDANTDDYVRALAVSADGTGLFIGGDFRKVGGRLRVNVAAVDAVTGAVDEAWNPGAPGGPVMALAVARTRLILGGRFVSVGGANAPRLAAVDATTGTVVPGWSPSPDGPAPEEWVEALVPSPDGTVVYAGGDFMTVGGRSRPQLAAIRVSDGTLTSWSPTLTYPVMSLAISPQGDRLYAGGAGGAGNGNRARALSTTQDGPPLWETWGGDGNVQAVALAPSGDTLFVGGHFMTLNGERRIRLAALRTADGSLTTFAPVVNSALGVWSLDAHGDALAIGGDFTLVAGRMQQGFARFPGRGPLLAVTSGPLEGAVIDDATPTYGGVAASSVPRPSRTSSPESERFA